LTAAGGFNLGFTTVNTLNEALGYFWSKGKNANALCDARQKAATQLIAAIANVSLLNDPGTCAGAEQMIADAQAALAGCDIAAIREAAAELDAFNNSGDLEPFPDGLKACGAGKDQKAIIANAVAPGAACSAGCP